MRKRKSALKSRAVKRKRQGALPRVWHAFRLIGAGFARMFFVIFGGVVVSLMFLYVYGYLLTSPYIRLEKVVFQGVDGQLKDELLEMADLDFQLSLLAINLDELKERLEAHPWIRSVDLEKGFPHTLRIRAEKEKPLVLVNLGDLYYMNRWGTLFKEAVELDSLDYPVVTGVSTENREKEKQLKVALGILRVLEKEHTPWCLDDLSEIHVRKDENVSLYFTFLRAEIRLRGTDLAYKMGDLKRLVEHLNGEGRIPMVRSINLNYGDAAAVSFRKG
ncbi:MAG: FtsQ-type POTRA domain-containing protein [Deltaproteobacteria bacterium]|jgi:cell division protein FtsQ